MAREARVTDEEAGELPPGLQADVRALAMFGEPPVPLLETVLWPESDGLSNLSHFYHLFKKSFGTSPLKAMKEGLKLVNRTSDS